MYTSGEEQAAVIAELHAKVQHLERALDRSDRSKVVVLERDSSSSSDEDEEEVPTKSMAKASIKAAKKK